MLCCMATTETFTTAESEQLVEQVAEFFGREPFMTADDFAAEVRRVRVRLARAHELPAD